MLKKYTVVPILKMDNVGNTSYFSETLEELQCELKVLI